MRPRSLLALAVLVALFGGYLFLVERKLPTTDERATQAKKVLTVATDEVRAVTVTWDDQIVRLQRAPVELPAADSERTPTPSWRLVEPMTAIADATAVGDFVRDLVALEKSRTIEDIDRANAGLAPPRATIALIHGEDGERQTVLEIGPEVPASDAMIVALAGGRDAYQVPRALWTTLTKSPGDWRDRQIFRGDRAAIERIRLLPTTESGPSSGGGVLLAKRGTEFWLESPVVDRADSALANGVLNQLTGMRVTDFVDPAGADDEAAGSSYGLAPPFGRIEIVLTGRAEPFVVEVGGTSSTVAEVGGTSSTGTIYARAGGQIFTTVASELRTALTRPADDWRSHAWTRWQVFDVEKATFSDASATTTLRRAEGEWLRDDDKIDFTTASDVLYALADVRASNVLERSLVDDETLAEPTATITLEAEDGRGEQLRVYRSAGRLLVTTAGRDAVLELVADALDDWSSKLSALRIAEAMVADENEDAAPDGQ